MLILPDGGVITGSKSWIWVATDMGGSNAPVSPQESARGILDYVERARLADSGRFVDFQGEPLSWD